MQFNTEDQASYAEYLQKLVREENKKPESIAQMFNLNNLHLDLKDIHKSTA